MTKSTRRWLFASLVLAFITLPAAFLTLSESRFFPMTSRGPDQTAARWFNGLSPDELVRAQTNIQRLPAAQQLFVVRTLTPKDQSDFWRSHLRSRMAANRSLSSGGVTAVNTLIETLSPELYGEPARFKGVRDAAVEQLKLAVDEKTLNELLYLPGEPVPTDTVSEKVLKTGVMTWLRQHVVVSAQIPPCECVQEWNTCPDSFRCSGGGSLCNPGGTVCFYGWLAGWGACYGLCGLPAR